MRTPAPDARPDVVPVPADALHELMRECFTVLGIRSQDASAVADVLLYANLRGIDSHGFDRVPLYMRRAHAGVAGGTEEIAVVSRAGALCRLDARHALGPAAGVRAVDLALELTRAHGLGLVALGNATHFGAAGYYARRACENGCIGIVVSNAFARMAPHGAAEPFLGSNPLAVALPMGARDPFVLDISSTVLAQGRIRRAQALGEELPAGAALDPEGRPTVDPAAALAGIMLPVGEHKGSGLALAISLLVGILAGADADDQVASVFGEPTRAQNLGQLFITIDPWRLSDAALVERRLHALADRLHALRPDGGAERVRYPGEGGAEMERERRAHGVPVARHELERLHQTCRELNVEGPAERVREILQDATRRAPRGAQLQTEHGEGKRRRRGSWPRA